MPPPSYEIERQNQSILENNLVEDYSFDPEYPERLYVSNIFQRSFSHLIAWTGKKAKKLECSDAGYLKTQTTGTTFSTFNVQKGNAPDAYGTPKDFGQLVSRVDIFTYDYACYLQCSQDGSTWSGERELPANFFISIDLDTRYIRIKNETGGNVCRFEFVGYY